MVFGDSPMNAPSSVGVQRGSTVPIMSDLIAFYLVGRKDTDSKHRVNMIIPVCINRKSVLGAKCSHGYKANALSDVQSLTQRNPNMSDIKIKAAVSDWLNIWQSSQSEDYVMSKDERKRYEGITRLIVRTPSADLSDLRSKVEAFECLDRNHDALCRSICEDVKRLA